MNTWDEIDRSVIKSREEFLQAEAKLADLGWRHLAVDDYGVWSAKHRYLGTVTARSGATLVAAAQHLSKKKGGR